MRSLRASSLTRDHRFLDAALVHRTLSSARRASWLCACLAVASSWAVEPAFVFAQDRAAAAKDLFDEGARLEEAGQFEEAGARFEEAANLVETPQIRLRAGRCQERAGQLIKAEKNIKRGIALATDDENLMKVGLELEAKIKGRIPTMVFQIEPTPHPPGLTVRVDGEDVLVTSPLRVDPRSHRVTAAAKGYLTYDQQVSVPEGETEIVTIRMVVGEDATNKPDEPSRETTYGPLPWILIGSGGGALAVSIGMGAGSASAKSDYLDAAPGAGCSVSDGVVTCKPGTETDPEVVELQSKADLSNGLVAGAVVFGVLAAGALGTGIALAVMNEELPPTVGFAPWFDPFSDDGSAGVSVVGTF